MKILITISLSTRVGPIHVLLQRVGSEEHLHPLPLNISSSVVPQLFPFEHGLFFYKHGIFLS